MEWDAQTLGDWTTVIEGADVVINLAGHNVNCRYNAQNRRLIKEVSCRINAGSGGRDRAGLPPAPCVASGEHGDNLRSPL